LYVFKKYKYFLSLLDLKKESNLLYWFTT